MLLLLLMMMMIRRMSPNSKKTHAQMLIKLLHENSLQPEYSENKNPTHLICAHNAS